ncbi:MAG: hypothetical protein ABSC37_14485 [Xanthobacteraceae bacterium]
MAANVRHDSRIYLIAPLPSLFQVSHGRYVVFQMAEVGIPRQMFQEILRLIANYGRSRHQRQRKAVDRTVFKSKTAGNLRLNKN